LEKKPCYVPTPAKVEFQGHLKRFLKETVSGIKLFHNELIRKNMRRVSLHSKGVKYLKLKDSPKSLRRRESSFLKDIVDVRNYIVFILAFKFWI